MAERFDVRRGGIILAGDRWPGGAQTVLLLHEGVADRRGWAEVAGLLAPELTVVAYDRRGYGQTPTSAGPFSHLMTCSPSSITLARARCGWPAPRREAG